jgi:hypothetical protein
MAEVYSTGALWSTTTNAHQSNGAATTDCPDGTDDSSLSELGLKRRAEDCPPYLNLD